jgi:5'(3')-deoxyribonucleotidase
MGLEILLDVDGCLADFLTGSFVANGLEMQHDDVAEWDFCERLERPIAIRDYMAACDAVPDFWLNLKPYPWAHYLYKTCRQYGNVTFATSPSLSADCARQKIEWLRRYGFMGYAENRFMIGPEKWLMSRPGTVLVDDYEVNVCLFADHGGYAIQFPQRWNLCSEFTDRRVEYVAECLRAYSVVCARSKSVRGVV